MELPTDLKCYRAPLGAFQLIDPEVALGWLCAIGFLCLVFRDYLALALR